jgi:hypothetical protein
MRREIESLYKGKLFIKKRVIEGENFFRKHSLFFSFLGKRRKILTRFSWTKQDGKIRSYL